MLGLGLRAARPVLSNPFLSRYSSRALFSFVATVPRLSPLQSCYSRHLQTLSQPPRTLLLLRERQSRIASTSSSVPSLWTIQQINKAEAEADADPSNVDAQVNLFKLLIQSERPAGWKVIMSRWERMCEFVSIEALDHLNKVYSLS